MHLTLEAFEQISPGAIFETGILPNSPDGIFMTRDGGELRWLAKKGFGNDWTIYCHWADKSFEWISQHGDKVYTKSNIQLCISCTDDVLDKYRF